MFCYLQQLVDVREARLASEIVRDVIQRDRGDRINDDVAIVHLIPIPNLDPRILPDPDAASDSAAADSFTKMFGEDHERRGP
jgi:hypothetical protein